MENIFINCPFCNKAIEINKDTCNHCGQDLNFCTFDSLDNLVWLYLLSFYSFSLIIVFILHAYAEFDLYKSLFSAYITLYIVFWCFYFRGKKSKTLRNLLHNYSAFWKMDKKKLPPRHAIIKSLEEKSRSDMTLLAIMIAATIILLQIIHNIYLNELLCYNFSFSNLFFKSRWKHLMILCSFLATISSLFLFLISVDTLDSLFNYFLRREHQIKYYFYDITKNSKYFAYILFIIGIIFIVASYNEIIACVFLGLFLSIGYTHWFPDKIEQPKTFTFKSLILLIILSGTPILISIIKNI